MFPLVRKHLADSGKSYGAHFVHAWRWGFYLIFTGMISLVHGLIPSWFPFTAPRNVLRVLEEVPERERAEWEARRK